MLRKSSDIVRYCYQRAAECRERALRANDSALKDTMVVAEDSWITLAHSYELTETLSNFGAELRRYLRSVSHMPACPQCGRPMRMVTTTPAASFINAQQARFDCICGYSECRLIDDKN